ncbi:MAG: ABC transporter permease subunit [Cyanobacteria bacterium]|nr:ABC transporter permease subunit [Cyanobacteriota bacterium]
MTLRLRSGQAFSWTRVAALARKDARELMRNPGAVIPAILMVFGSLFPMFLVVFLVPMIMGQTLEQSGEFAEEAANAVGRIPELAGLSGNALIQTFLFHQFSLLLLLVPIVSGTALATHAVIGEKQSKALEPLLATPISTIELLAAKTLTPFLFALGLTWAAVSVALVGAITVGEPGVWRSIVGPRLFLLFGLLGPLVELASLQVSVIVSSRTSDPRSAQQLTALLILPVTIAFVAQLMGLMIVGPRAILLGAAGCVILNAILAWLGVQVFQRESILTRWT